MGLKRKTMENGRKAGKRERAQNHPDKSESAKQTKKDNDIEMDEDYVHYASSDEGIQKEEAGKNVTSEAVLDNGSDESDDSDDDMEDAQAEIRLAEAQEGESDVDVTLDFYDPRQDDVSAIASFLDSWTRRVGNGMNVENLSKAICTQTRVGTTVRVEDDEAPVGFITCLNVRRHAELLSGLRNRLKKECKKSTGKDDGAEFMKVLESCFEEKGRFEHEKMGLILTERVVNMPPAIVPKLLEAVFCEIEWAVEDEPTQELREDYRFGWYLYITEAYLDKTAKPDAANEKTGNKKKKQKTGDGDEAEEERIGFLKIEDEAWFKLASKKVSWSLATEPDRNEQSGRKGIAMLIAAKHVPDVRKMVENLAGTVQEETPAEVDEEKEDS